MLLFTSINLKTDIHVKSLFKRLDNVIHGSSSSSSKRDISTSKTISQQELDDIETQKYGEPLRFSDYRHARCKKTAPAVGSHRYIITQLNKYFFNL
jgi:hypothetical protein